MLACKSSPSVAGKAKYKLKRLQEKASGHNAECTITGGLVFSLGAAESAVLYAPMSDDNFLGGSVKKYAACVRLSDTQAAQILFAEDFHELLARNSLFFIKI